MKAYDQFAAIVALGLGLTACQTNQTGNLDATHTGDTSHPAQRGSPNADLTLACGAGEATRAGSVVHREPYLQQVTTTSAIIGWVTSSPDGEHVDITLPDGTPITTADGAVDASAMESADQRQKWARIAGLEPDTIYCYEIAGAEPLAGRAGFRTAPAADDPDTVRFIAFGDSGRGDGDQLALEAQMSDVPYDLILHTGDLAYGSGTLTQFQSTVFDVYAELLRNIPFYPAAGNHDYETLSGAPFRSVFALPRDETWYSYDYGRVHFVALDTEADYATQAAWLDDDLAATELPWKIVYMHRPPYSSGVHGSDTGLRARLAPVLEQHHVQLVLAGHDHDYERTTPQDGVVYVVTGGGGIGTRNVGSSSFTAFSAEVIHFVYVEVGDDELTLHAIDGIGQEFDSVVVSR